MRSQSGLGAYLYPAANAAHPHSPNSVGADTFTYDLNGNMTAGLYGKTMAYDGENRPVSVSLSGATTAFVYGPDGARQSKGHDLRHHPLFRRRGGPQLRHRE